MKKDKDKVTWLGQGRYSHAFRNIHSPFTCNCPTRYKKSPFVEECQRIPSKLGALCGAGVYGELGKWMPERMSKFDRCPQCEGILNREFGNGLITEWCY